MAERLPIFLASGIRFGIAAAVLLIWLQIKEGGFPRIERKEWCWLTLQSFAGVFLFSICLLVGVRFTTAMEAGILTATTPALVAVLSVWLLKEKWERSLGAGLLLAIGGVAILKFHAGFSDTQVTFSWLGNFLVMMAVAGEALFTVVGKILSPRLSPLAISTAVAGIGFLCFFPFAIVQAWTFDFSSLTGLDLFLLLYHALIVTVLAFFLWYTGVSRVRGSVSGLFTAVMPLTAVLLSVMVLGEALTHSHLIGMALVLAGIAAGTWRSGEGSSVEREKEDQDRGCPEKTADERGRQPC